MQLKADRRTANAFRIRRAQIVLASARRWSPKPIAQLVGCSVQTVRNVLHAFHTRGLESLAKASKRPKTVAPVLDAAQCERLQPILHQAPRLYDTPRGVWTLALAAAVCDEYGITARLRNTATSHRALQRLKTNWQRATHWLTSPEPHSARKKVAGSPESTHVGAPRLVLGFQDAVWWSRLAQPHHCPWTDAQPLPLLQKEPDRHDPEPKAVTCYGL